MRLLKRTIWALFFLIVLYAGSTDQPERDLFSSFFKNLPYETVLIYCYDGTTFGYTEEQAGTVYLRISWLKDKLEERGKTMKDIKVIVHNHPSSSRNFSPADRKQYQILKQRGFNGSYLLWVNGEIVQEIKAKE